MTTGSFDAPHFGGTDLKGALARARDLLGAGDDLSHLSRLQRLAWSLLRDACRLAAAVPHLIDAAKGDAEISAESIEVIVRKVLEHAILLEYLHENEQDEEVVARFLSNCQAAYDRSNKKFRAGGNKPPDWPNYEQMAASQPAFYDLYRRLSYLAHPKTCLPYALVERQRGLSAAAFFQLRAELSAADMTQILHGAVDSALAMGVTASTKTT